MIRNKEQKQDIDFFEYWESLGFFNSLQSTLPPQFFLLFEIAKTLFTDEKSTDALSAIDDITAEEKIYEPDREENIQVNRVDKSAPVSDKMELDNFRKITELKNALPRELALDDDIFDIKLFTKTLIVQKFFESESDSFKPISTVRDESGKDANKFEQKFYVLLDRSRSMDMKMRSFYSKCIIAEFLRRKLNSKAKLYYRSFDSKVGKLYKIETREDFPRLIQKILYTQTGGTSTNIQGAVLQAISDIKFEKDMMNSEILIVTDGISKIDKHQLEDKLGSIKLNVLKIGDELAETDYYDMKQTLDYENINFDPSSINLKKAKTEIENIGPDGSESPISPDEQRAYRFILDYSDRIFKDLKDISTKYIEIKDFNPEGIGEVSEDTFQKITDAVDGAVNFNSSILSPEELEKFYKQIHFLSQYIEMFLSGDSKSAAGLKPYLDKLLDLKQKLLKDPALLLSVMQVKDFDEDKKIMKLAKKDAKKLMKEMELENKKLGIKELKKAQMLFTFDVGEGSMGQFMMLIFIKLMQFLKKVILLPFSPFKKTKEKERQ